MSIADNIKIICKQCNISEAELARRLGKSPQCFNAKMKRQRFTLDEIEAISNAIGVGFEYKFVWPNGEKIK